MTQIRGCCETRLRTLRIFCLYKQGYSFQYFYLSILNVSLTEVILSCYSHGNVLIFPTHQTKMASTAFLKEW